MILISKPPLLYLNYFWSEGGAGAWGGSVGPIRLIDLNKMRPAVGAHCFGEPENFRPHQAQVHSKYIFLFMIFTILTGSSFSMNEYIN